MFGSLSCDHGYFQLSPRKVLGRGEKETETVTRAPSLEATQGQARPGESFVHSLAAERASPPEAVSPVFAVTSAVTQRSSLTRCSGFTSPSEGLPRNESHHCPEYIMLQAPATRAGTDQGRQEGAPRRLPGPELWATPQVCPLQAKARGRRACTCCLQPQPSEQASRVPPRTSRNRLHGLLLQTGSRKTKPECPTLMGQE